MDRDLKKGLIISLSIYGIGALLTVIVHQIYGWKNPHAPPMSFLPILATFAVGLVRAVINLHSLTSGNTRRAQGELFVHVLVALSLIVVLKTL